MSDFESSLKKAWEACPCRRVFADSMQADECEGRHCSCSRAGQKDESYVSKCRWSGHAALLEMVDVLVLRPKTLRHERDMKEERRRLRATVGGDNE